MKKILFLALLLSSMCMQAKTNNPSAKLVYSPEVEQGLQLTFPDGSLVEYTALRKIYYVTQVADSAYQYMNIFVPKGATEQSPIFLRNYVGGYMASQASNVPLAGDASGRALKEGYVVVIPGARGRNSVVQMKKKTVYTGRAPQALLDLKAAVRYLREFDAEIPGNTSLIVSDGTSAGGAMSSLLGATGNHTAYSDMLKAMGAANQRDDVFASVCYCPIIDLDHADMAYEWVYNQTDSRQKGREDVLSVSRELAESYPQYLSQLNLHTADGVPVTADNEMEIIKKEIIRAAQLAKNAGADIPDSIGFTFSEDVGFGAPPVNGGMTQKLPAGGKMPGGKRPPFIRNKKAKKPGEYIVDLDMTTYLNYVVSTQPLKTAPAFDTQGVCNQNASGENEEFGDASGSSVNFTQFSAMRNGTSVSKGVAVNVALMNPMNFIGDDQSAVAPHWYIRHGARDRDTAFAIPLNLALKLQNSGKNVNFLLAWNRPHSGDYALDELFAWLGEIIQ